MRTKVLAGLCAVLFLIASAEAVLLVRDHWTEKKIATRDPFRAMQQMVVPDPWARFHDSFFGDFDDDPLFKDFGRNFFEKFRRRHLGSPLDHAFGHQFTDTFSFETPRWEDQGKEMRMVMDIKGHEQGDYSVNVSGEQVTLVGKDKVSKNEQGMNEESHWSNTQSFPPPPEVDPKSFRVERTKDQFIVIFKKREPRKVST